MRLPFRIRGKLPDYVEDHARNGLKPCPQGSQNCVCSLNQSDDAAVASLPLYKDLYQSKERIKVLAEQLENASLASETKNYLRFECESEFFGFVDDLEFEINVEKSLIQVRSQSRLGVKDFGVNRKRYEQFADLWLKDFA